jgi:hypothetical protein
MMTEKAVPAEHSRPAVPAGLAVRGRRFWRETTEKYEVSASELQLLREVCRTMDNLDDLAAAIAADGATVLGSKGQQVVNPALTEARGQRLALHRLIAALALPDEVGEAVPSVARLRASKAAAARWAGHQTDAQRRAALGA